MRVRNTCYPYVTKFVGLNRVGILHIGHITDSPLIWAIRSRAEKGPSQLFIPNYLVQLFR